MGTTEFKSKVAEVTFQSAAAATGNGTSLRLDGASAILAQVTGITTATITWEATLNGTTWVAIQATSLNSATTATTATADGLYLLNCSGAALVRARISAWTSGTITVTGRSTSMPFALASAGGGGGGLLYWEEGQTTVDTYPVDSWTPQSAGSITVNDPWVPVSDVVPDITGPTVSYYVGTFLAGRYRVNYIEGALQYAGGLWGLNAGAPYGFRVVHSGGAATIEGPYTTYTQQASQADVEAANAGAYVEFDHAGGTIGVYLQDIPYADNDPGTPNPTFELIGLPTTIDNPVSAVVQALGQGGMVLSDGISAVPDPVLGQMIQRFAAGYSFLGGNAAFAARVSGANPVGDQDFVTKAYLSSRYFDFSAWTASNELYAGDYSSKFTPNNTQANVNAVIQPKGSGSLLAQVPDGTSVGGNVRGLNSVDWQTNRSSADQVASGECAVIGGGLDSVASGNYSVVAGGQTNEASGLNSAVLGGYGNTAQAQGSIVLGGFSNLASGLYSSVLFGTNNAATGQNALAAGTDAISSHSGSLVVSSANSGGASSTNDDQCLLNFDYGYDFAGGSIRTGVWRATPVEVQYGGTGRALADAYAVVCGGATDTDVHQSVSALGTAGQVLTSAGAGALPTWADVAGTGAAPGDQIVTLPLSIYGADTHLLGEPDGWLLINGKNVPYYD